MIRTSFGIKYLLVLITFISSLYAVELDWGHDYNKALIQAKKEHKDVYLFIGADKCKFCDMFKKDTLSDKEIMDRLTKDYILLYMSRDQHKVPSKFKVKGAPRHYFLDADGNIIHGAWGSREVAGFHSVLDEADLNKED